MFPSPNPCLLIPRNNRGCSHLPKTPSLGKEREKAVSWLTKAETPVCQKPTDVRQAKRRCRSICPAHCARTRVVWVGYQLGWETHTRGKDSFGLISLLLCSSASHVSLSLELYLSTPMHCQKKMLAQKGLESSCIRSLFAPSSLFLSSRLEGLEGQMERKAVLAEPLS